MINTKYFLILAIALGLVAVFVTRPKNNEPNLTLDLGPSSWSQKPGQASTSIDVGATGDYTLSRVAGERPPPYPQYRRTLKFPDYFNAEAKAITQKLISDLQVSLDKDKRDIKAWIELGNQYHLVRDYEGARLCWEYALALNPNAYLALANLGTLYMGDIKNYKLSESYLRRAITADSTQIPAYRSLYELYRYALKDDVKARAILNEGIVKNSGKATDLEYLRDHYNEQ